MKLRKILLLSVLVIAGIYALLSYTLADSLLNCTIKPNSSCSGTAVLYLQNDTGGYMNAHAQNVSVGTYNYVVCCNLVGIPGTLSTTCEDVSFLKLWNNDNAHVELPFLNNYNTSACLSYDQGKIDCAYSIDSCGANRECLVSIASSYPVTNNQTNCHVSDCSDYSTKICCWVISKPTHTTPVLNSTYGQNLTYENLTCYNQSTSDADGDAVTNIYSWYKNRKPIMVLNMPFDINISSNGTNLVRDYSGYNNNGTLGNGNLSHAPAWTSSGKIGGAYVFDGADDFILIGDPGDSSLDMGTHSFSLEAWIKATSAANTGRIISKRSGVSGYELVPRNNVVSVLLGDGTDYFHQDIGSTNVLDNQWHHIIAVINRSNKFVYVYVDGTSDGSYNFSNDNIDDISNSANLYIGRWTGGQYFNGTIDNVRIYNLSLSAEQAYQRWLDTKDGYSSHETIVSSETVKGQNWTCSVTPNDATQDGITLNSTTLTIRNTPPSPPNLTSPPDGNETYDRTPTFMWNASYDPDYDNITYDLYIRCLPSCSVDNRSYKNITGLNYTLTEELKYFGDDGYYYEWFVTPFDGTDYGNHSAIFNFTLRTAVILTMVNDSVNFGVMGLGEINDTADDIPSPLAVQNDGNVVVDVNLSADKYIWDAVYEASDYFQYKADNYTGEVPAFNYTASATNWTNVTLEESELLKLFNYSDSNDVAEIDIRLKVPLDEPAGNKSSLLTVTGYYVRVD